MISIYIVMNISGFLFFMKCFAKKPLSIPSSMHPNVAQAHLILVGETLGYSYLLKTPALSKDAVRALPMAPWVIFLPSFGTNK